MKKLVTENIRISLDAIKTHRVRSILTVAIIAFGIMALVGILTAIDSIKYSLTENFAMMGSNSFSVRNRELRINIGGDSQNNRSFRNISFNEAERFKEEFTFPATVSIFSWGTGTATLKFESEKTDPNTQILGSDADYLATAGIELEKGRVFNTNEVYFGSNVAIIGDEIAKKLFKGKEDPINKIVSVGPGKYKIIGVLKEKGSSMGFNAGRRVILPLNNVRQYFSRPNMSFTINVMVNKPEEMDAAIGETTGLFRMIRRDILGQDDTFSIAKSDSVAQMLIDLIKYVTLAATFIGLITLMGAAIGLMNIMLVSVTERTREIGIRKAIGATKTTIRNQFLIESIVIAQLGGLVGIFLGILVGNIMSFVSGSAFIVPWMWIILGVVLCFIVAVISGIVPANKAAKLDPIESLRYE